VTGTWQTQEWKDKAAEFVKGKSCEWCGATENLVPHHPKRKEGYTHDEYMSLEGCKVFCGKCNFMESKGFKICPVCKKKYFKPKHGREQMCWSCFSQTSLGKSVKDYYEKHPEELKKKLRHQLHPKTIVTGNQNEQRRS
jgi:hypothetical protein